MSTQLEPTETDEGTESDAEPAAESPGQQRRQEKVDRQRAERETEPEPDLGDDAVRLKVFRYDPEVEG
ncbi:MAG: succinate dehydrogenase, partial [Halolamina sp.]